MSGTETASSMVNSTENENGGVISARRRSDNDVDADGNRSEALPIAESSSFLSAVDLMDRLAEREVPICSFPFFLLCETLFIYLYFSV